MQNCNFACYLFGCETWLVTLREERSLWALRRIFGPKRGGVTGEWRKQHNAELNDLYFSANIVRVIKSRRMRWAVHVARTGQRRGAYMVLVGKPEGKNHLEDPDIDGRIMLKWVFRTWDGGSMDWIYLAQDRDRWRAVVNGVTNLRVP